MTAAIRVGFVAFVLCGMTGIFYAAGPPPAHTGGFGEETCAYCHFESPVNDPEGDLQLRGVPVEYTPDGQYTLEVALRRPGLVRGGFQLSARFSDGGSEGGQAGLLAAQSDRIAIDTLGGIQYVRHTYPGSDAHEQDSVVWQVNWTAPKEKKATVVFHLAANAANGDDSEFGDFIYVGREQSGGP